MDIAILILVSIAIMVGLLNLFKRSNFSEEKIEEIKKQIEQENRFTRESMASTLKVGNDAVVVGVKTTNDAIISNVNNISRTNETRIMEMKEELARNLAEIKNDVNKNLKEVREDNTKQLNEMRNVVEEKMSKTLNERLSNSFSTINERLESVYKGLGQMQQLAGDVKGLQKVLSNVKTRGSWGEVSLDNLLESILTKDQYIKGCNVTGRGQEQVDFAIILPGTGKEKIYLPIDVKFPTEDYQRLIEASEGCDLQVCSDAVKSFENAVKKQAKSIKDKYVKPPKTTDFAIMYLPTEGLYAEILRNSGLVEELQNKYNVTPAGPTNITALLNSLQLGFKTLAIKKSSLDVFKVFEAFKKDFSTFVENLEKAKSQIGKASDTLELATKRTDIIQKKLNRVEDLKILELKNSEEEVI